MAKLKKKAVAKPKTGIEVSAISSDDVGAAYADELRLPGDGILRERGGGDVGIYEKIYSDWQCYSNFKQLRTAVISKEFMVDAGAEDSASQNAADFWRALLPTLGFDAVCHKSFMGVWYGFSPSEMIFETDGRQIFIDSFKTRKARRFRFGADNSLRLITKSNPKGIIMPENKFWVFQAGADDDDDPYGLGLAYYCYWPVWLKRNALRHWSLFLETFARGRALAKVPPGTKADKVKEVRAALNTITSGGTAVISDNVAIEILEAMRNSGGDFHTFCKYLDGAISKIINSQTMTTDDGSSRSQAEVHQGVGDDVAKSYADLQCESFNRGPVALLTEWNFPGAVPPRVYRNCEEEADVKTMADTDRIILDFGYKPTPERILETYGDGYVPIQEGPAQPTDAGGETENEDEAEFAEGDLVGSSSGPGGVADSATSGDEWRPLVEPTVEAIESLADDCDSLAEFRERLGEIAQSDPDSLREGVARTIFAARTAGRVGAEVTEDHGDG